MIIPDPTPATPDSRRRPPLAQRLRDETAELHRELEQQLDVRPSRWSMNRYRWLLRMFLGYYDPLESALAESASAMLNLPFPPPDRSSRLERDLVALGMSADRVAGLPRCSDLPPLCKQEHVAGCLYVMEGAALGGQIIAREVAERFGLAEHRGSAFFVGEGKGTADRWRVVLHWLGQIERDTSDEDEVVSAACHTFRTLAVWAEHRGPAPP